ncbi:fimbria/pilus outer membrane usher protein [Rahnella ecdela]|uniref:Fimbrial biogenesis outer membrane usher protein n=1 Tax=Rahnella ecdela TaxID=2816250 RepID=A0ABS6LCX8_9GAMM|nr:fimbria/pilus outer membrane usher protein [Rahnella ecdela]MBU9844784.1 fimbrial biogenesis outer membrane usher protein [Rahnella ecdela]
MKSINTRQNTLRLLTVFVAFALHKNALSQEYINELPTPITLSPEFSPEYNVNVILNGNRLATRVPIKITDNHYLVPRFYLTQHLRAPTNLLPKEGDTLVDIRHIAGMTSRYDNKQHALVISVPPAWLPEQAFSATQGEEHLDYSPSSGAALDYDGYVSRNSLVDTGALFLGGRFFTGSGYLYASGTANRYSLHRSGSSNTTYTRYLTYYRQYFADNDTSLVLGDFISEGGVWDSGVRMGGVSFRKDFKLSPDKNIYQSPSVRGTAKTPSIVDIFMDNRKITSNSVDSGPYEISNLPFINGAGQVTVVTTDKLGNKTNETVQLYKSNSLLAQGMHEFSANVGYLRYNYGYSDSKYRNLAFSGYLSRGVNALLTQSVFLQSAQRLQMAGSGVNFLVAPVGTFSITGAVSTDNESDRCNGGRAELGYSYANSHINFSYNHSQYTRNFTDLGNYGYHNDGYSSVSTRSVDQVWLSHQWQNSVTLGLGYFYIQPYGSDSYSMGNISLSTPTPLQGQLTLSLSAYNASGQDMMSMLNWSVPIGSRTRMQYTMSHSSLGYRNDMNLSWGDYGPQQTHADLQVTRDEAGYRYERASLYHSNQYANLSAGLYGYDNKTYWLEGSGTVTLAGGSMQLNRESHGAFVLVNAGIPNLPYYNGGNLAGYTNSRGYGFIQNVPAGIPVEISVDPTHLPADYHAAQYRQKVRLYPHSGTEVKFGGKKGLPARFRLVDSEGHSLPLGSVIRDESAETSTFVGYGGSTFLYLNDAKPVMLSVYRGAAPSCRVVIQPRNFTTHHAPTPTFTCR